MHCVYVWCVCACEFVFPLNDIEETGSSSDDLETWGLSLSLSTTSSTASSCDTEFTKEDEQRLKDYIQQLKNDRAAVKLTMLELESIHIDPLSYDVKPRGDSQRLDLENAVLMQELMAMKVCGSFHLLRPPRGIPRRSL